MPFKRYLTIVVIVLLLLIHAGCGDKKSHKDSDDTPRDLNEITKTQENEQVIPKVKNPLTGIDMDIQYEKQRPLAVMIENEYNARPQSGLNKAGIVYEILTEGGITRFLAIFLGETVDEIGPVRSARPYFLDYAMEYDSIYIHYGASPQGYIDLKKLNIDAINGIYDDVTFWRDRSRKEPHNAYTNTEKILKTSEKKGFIRDVELTLWKFNTEETFAGNQALEECELEYFKNYVVSYTYDRDKKMYKRYINGELHTDKKTGEQILVKNIILQFAVTKVVDDVGRLSINTVDSGKGYYISNGYCNKIKWQKDDRKERTNYTFEDGSELIINPGNIWIQILPQWGKFNYE
ncbi:MAG: DUF3048 domain-containing protein [Tepidanaerobacter acetatoxydans]|uniref:DUF3048 domain-containing protein n=1 Tax=Tepidanaerobacter acetatoxydans TaxID=499229 RepID=UPI0026EF9736|nr:DUF3048 domain-containing protein [Tepidanaerobacter acetatoxydans]NLU10552.1 DUF3048 domain-containing protein [Tepidanaerobacter acetatoxydans]